MKQRRNSHLIEGAVLAALLAAAATQLLAQAPEPAKGVKYTQVNAGDMKEWLTFLSSDELQGRQVFTEGYGLAAAYVADHLKSWGVKGAGDGGSYFEDVKLRGYKTTRNSSVTIVAKNGTSTTFKHGDHVTFVAGPGGKRTLMFTGAEFIGYGQAGDLKGREVKDKLVIWMQPSPQVIAAGFAAGAGRGGGRGG